MRSSLIPILSPLPRPPNKKPASNVLMLPAGRWFRVYETRSRSENYNSTSWPRKQKMTTPKSGQERRQRRKLREVVDTTEPVGTALPALTVEEPPVVTGELVGSAETTRYSGKGGDVKMLARSLREGWDMSTRARSEAIAAVHEALAGTLTARDRSALTKVLISVDRVKIEAEKLDVFAELNGLHSSEAAAPVDIGESASSYYRRLVDACQSVEEVHMLRAIRLRVGDPSC